MHIFLTLYSTLSLCRERAFASKRAVFSAASFPCAVAALSFPPFPSSTSLATAALRGLRTYWREEVRY